MTNQHTNRTNRIISKSMVCGWDRHDECKFAECQCQCHNPTNSTPEPTQTQALQDEFNKLEEDTHTNPHARALEFNRRAFLIDAQAQILIARNLERIATVLENRL